MATIFQKMRAKANALMVKNNTDMISLPAETALTLGMEYVTIKGDKDIQGINFDEEYVPIKDGIIKKVLDAVRKELNDIHLYELSEEDVNKLRSQIVMGSIYVADYNNTFGVSPKEVCDYADSYIEVEDDYDSFYDYIQSVDWIV